MYTSFYNLKSKPFQIASDPAFIWLGEKHKEALATLTYGVLDNKGFMLLTGDVGTGKTTLINTLIKGLSDDILYASVPDPRLGLIDFLNYIANAFNIRKNFESKGKFLIYFSDFLARAYANKKKVLLLIDEAQLLTQDLLEEIRLLSNIQKDGQNLLNIFFVGQDEFNEILDRTENRAVAQRMTLNYHLAPLSERETASYIQHRLSVAGTTEQLFDAQAVREIHAYSGGFPRRINIICDHCLLTGFVQEQRMIDAEIVRRCAHDLKIPQYTGRRNPSPRPVDAPPQVAATQVSAPVGAPAASPAAIPVARPMSRSAPSRPIQRRRPGSLRPLFIAVALLVGGAALLFFLDRPRFDAIATGVSHYLTSTQSRFDDPALPPAPTATIAKPPESSVPGRIKEGNAEVRPPVPASPAKLKPNQKVVEPAATTDTEDTGGNEDTGGTSTVQPPPGPAKTPDPAGEPAVAPADVQPADPAGQAAAGTGVGENTGGSGETGATASVTVPKMVGPEPAAQTIPAVKPNLPPPKPELPTKTVIVRFDNDSSEFYFSDLERVDDFVNAVKQHPKAVLVLTGHTDSFGSEGYNYRLSLFRANMLKSFFLGKGIPAQQMQVRALGGTKPLMSNDTAEGRSKNRRVEIDVQL